MTDRRLTIVRLLLLWVLLELAAAAQVRSASGSSLLAVWLSNVTRPVSATAETIVAGIEHVAATFGSTQKLVTENRRLREELEFSRARRMLLESDLEVARELERVLELADIATTTPIAARCVFRDPMLGSMQLRVAGSAPVPRDTPVLGPGGLVGRVIRCRADTCWVELVTHPAAAVAVQASVDRVPGLAVGTGGPELEVRYVSRTATVLVGQVLTTSGADGIYPIGLPVAEVTRVRETDSPFLHVQARPIIDVTTLRAVLLVPGITAAGPDDGP